MSTGSSSAAPTPPPKDNRTERNPQDAIFIDDKFQPIVSGIARRVESSRRSRYHAYKEWRGGGRIQHSTQASNHKTKPTSSTGGARRPRRADECLSDAVNRLSTTSLGRQRLSETLRPTFRSSIHPHRFVPEKNSRSQNRHRPVILPPMADHLTPERRSWNMSRIRNKNTQPELRVRSLLPTGWATASLSTPRTTGSSPGNPTSSCPNTMPSFLCTAASGIATKIAKKPQPPKRGRNGGRRNSMAMSNAIDETSACSGKPAGG